VRGRRLETDDVIVFKNSIIDRAQSIFDAAFYVDRYIEVEGSRYTPTQHFIRAGFGEGRNPCALFDTDWYRRKYALPSNENCLAHYLREGYESGFEPSPYFDSQFYRSQARDISANISPLEHFRTFGWKRLLDIHPLFDTAWYLDQLSKPLDIGIVPIEHYINGGWRTGNSPSPMFMPDSYFELNIDVKLADANPLLHYLEWGLKEGRSVSELIDSDQYVAQYPDDPMARSWGAAAHFARFGSCEGRTVSPDPLAQRIAQFACDRARRLRNHLDLDGYGVASSDPFNLKSRLSSLTFESSTNPRVSVIIPTFNHIKDVVACLETIAIAADQVTHEVIVVDDCSSPSESALLAKIPGVRYIRHDSNTGFSGSCTTGIEASHSEFVFLLNNDTEVFPGWLDSPVAEMDLHPKTGVVGSMILRCNMRLQEAGGIIWSDGTGAHYGSNDNPMEYKYRFRREVDYCSGASLLIRSELWEEVGGFDEELSPAYYEDTDFCFSSRKHGYGVVYQPNSLIVHREGSSNGLESFGLKRRQHENRHFFAEKWHSELTKLSKGLDVSDSQKRYSREISSGDRRIVVVDYFELTPDQDSGSLRMSRIVEEFVSMGFKVHFVSLTGGKSSRWADAACNLGVEVLHGAIELQTTLQALNKKLDFVFISRPEVFASVIDKVLLFAPEIPIIYDMVDAHGLRMHRKSVFTASTHDTEKARYFEAIEKRAARSSDVVVAVSQSDLDHLRKVSNFVTKSLIIPNVHIKPSASQSEFSQREGILFVGGFQHDPNVDAAKFLVNEVMPKVKAIMGEVQVFLVGSKPTREVLELSSRNVTVTGWVDDLRPVYDKARIFVAPLRYGAGVKGKIGESLSFGLPTITTSIGVEGMDVEHGVDLFIAETADEIANRICEIYNNEELLASIAKNGSEKIETLFGKASLRKRLQELVDFISERDD
jgi:GT2 family glycosyltransferase/glycosyltransferase involved in cell wall biosynthesis